jgi:hexokinase
MYLGEITRNVLLALVDAAPVPLLFDGMVGSGTLNKHYGMDTAVMSEIEEAWCGDDVIEATTGDGKLVNGHSNLVPENLQDIGTEKIGAKQKQRLERVKQVITHRLGFENSPEQVSLEDAAIVRWVCSLVAERAAKLSGCAVAAIVVQTGLGTLCGNGISKKTELLNEKGQIGVGVDGRFVFLSLCPGHGLTRSTA